MSSYQFHGVSAWTWVTRLLPDWPSPLALWAEKTATKTQTVRYIPIRDDRCEQFQSLGVLPETLPAKVSGRQLSSLTFFPWPVGGSGQAVNAWPKSQRVAAA